MKAIRRSSKSSREGAALVTMMIVLLLVCMASAALISFANQQAHAAERVRDYMKAQAYAEAGINEAYNLMKTNFANAGNAALYPAVDFEDGGYDVTVTPVGDDQASLVSVGECGDATITVAADVKNLPLVNPGSGGSVPPTSPYAYTLFVNGDLTHNGVSDVKAMVQCNSKLTANGNLNWGAPIEARVVTSVRMNGGGSSIDGTVWSPSITGSGTTGDKITTKIEAPCPVVDFPTLNLDPYYAIAQANGQVFAGGTYSGTFSIPGGVRWFNGNVTLKSITYTGCIIATGSITFNGGVDQTKLGRLPAVISRDGYVRFNGSRDIHGLVYARGDLTFNGEGTLTGSAIVGGNCTFNGKSGVLAYEYSEPFPDASGGNPGSFADRVIITAWQK